MRHSSLAVSTALAAVLAVGTAQAQAQGTQQSAASGQGAQVSSQRIANEVARAKGTEIYISPAGTRQIQQSLNKKGYDVGNVDGTWNKRTARAAANFEQAQGLEPTGSLTVSLIQALGMTNLLDGQVTGAQGQQAAAGGGSGQRLAQEKATDKGTILHVSPAGVRVVQQTLNAQGYDVGKVNGQWSKDTSRAAANFQQANGLEPTGVLDVSLLQNLGVCQRVFSAGQNGNGAGNGGGGSSQRIAQEAIGTDTLNNSGSSGGNSGQQLQGTPLYISTAGVRDVTQKLNTLGYDAGKVDGQWDKGTTTATANFEQAKGLEPTGTLTTAFLAAAGLNQWLPTQACSASGARQASAAGANGANGANGIKGVVGAQGAAAGATASGNGANGTATAANGAAGTGTGAGGNHGTGAGANKQLASTAGTQNAGANASQAAGSVGGNQNGAGADQATGSTNAGNQGSSLQADQRGGGSAAPGATAMGGKTAATGGGSGASGQQLGNARIEPQQQQADITTPPDNAGGGTKTAGATGATGGADQTAAATGGAAAGVANAGANGNGNQQVASLGQNGQQPMEGANIAVNQGAKGRQNVTVRNLIRYGVVGANGKKIGDIEKIVNMNNRLYAVAGRGGFLGIGEQKVAIPLSSVVLRNKKLVAPKLTSNQAQSLNDLNAQGYTELTPNQKVTIGTM